MSCATAEIQHRRSLRQQFRARRRALTSSTQSEHALAVVHHLRAANLLLRNGTVAAYLTNHRDGELDALPIIRQLWKMRRLVVLPVVSRVRGAMNLYPYSADSALAINRYGIGEPVDHCLPVALLSVSLVLLPLVAFDDAGGRLGMGGGYYDRMLGTLPGAMRPRLVGLAHEVQYSQSALPAGDHDIALDDLVTEAGWRQFSKPKR